MKVAIVFECPCCERPVAGGSLGQPLVVDEHGQVSALFLCTRCNTSSQVLVGRLLKGEGAS